MNLHSARYIVAVCRYCCGASSQLNTHHDYEQIDLITIQCLAILFCVMNTFFASDATLALAVDGWFGASVGVNWTPDLVVSTKRCQL